MMSQNSTILIVDDEPRFCDSTRLLLSLEGYRVLTSLSGLEACSLLSSDHIDLALIDLGIPDMNGHELMKNIQKNHPGIPVIVVTGNSSLDQAVMALKTGAYDYIQKPFEFEKLLKTVQNALNEKKLKHEKAIIGEKLELSEDRYQYLVQNSPDIIYTLDQDGNFTFINNSVERILGFRTCDLIGKHYTCLIHDEDREKAKWTLLERRADERTASCVRIQMKSLKHDVDAVACELKHVTVELKRMGMYDARETDIPPTYLGTHGVVRDISDRIRLEEQLQHARKMEALGTLSGGIAHDFNNLLMIIQGQISMILMGVDPGNPHHLRLKRIEESIRSGSALTSQLLGFARGGKYQIKPVNVNTALRETARMFGRTRKEIVIREQYEKCIWTVEADVRQLEQVFLNLFVNAFHAMPGGGDLSLMTQNHIVRDGSDHPVYLNPGKYVKISVTDNGTGMDEKIRRRIFDPFFSTKSKGRGTGLGLTSAYGIIKNHGGSIDVVSKPGIGTTFTIYLPASIQEVVTEESVCELFLKGDETVLVVDDEAEMIEVMQDMLHTLGYVTLSASTVKMAIDLYRQHQHEIGLVILDMIMPETGGREAYEELKKINPEIRVLLCSGYSTAGKAEEILNRGCNGFIQKPFNAGELSIKLREILDGPGHS